MCIRRNTFLIKHSYPPHQSGLSLSDWINHGGREGGHMHDSPLDFKSGASPKGEKLGRPGRPSPLSCPVSTIWTTLKTEDCCRGRHSGSKSFCHLEEPHDQQDIKLGLVSWSVCPCWSLLYPTRPCDYTAIASNPLWHQVRSLFFPKSHPKSPIATAISCPQV